MLTADLLDEASQGVQHRAPTILGVHHLEGSAIPGDPQRQALDVRDLDSGAIPVVVRHDVHAATDDAHDDLLDPLAITAHVDDARTVD